MPVSVPDPDNWGSAKRRALAQGVQEEAALKKSKEALEKLLSTVTRGSDEYKKLSDRIDQFDGAIKGVNADLDKHLDKLGQGESKLKKFVTQYEALSVKIDTYATGLGKLLDEEVKYNLTVQKIIDSTGKFAGQTDKGRRAFEDFRHALKLTRQEGEAWGKTWSNAMRVGLGSAEQIKKMGKDLTDVFGRSGAMAAMEKIGQAPVGRTTMGALGRRDVGAIQGGVRQAALSGDAEGIKSLSGLLRESGGRTKPTEASIAYEKKQAELRKSMDDAAAAIAETGLAVSPEFAAMIMPLNDMNKYMVKIAKHVEGIWSYVTGEKEEGGDGGGGGGGGGGGDKKEGIWSKYGGAITTAVGTAVTALGFKYYGEQITDLTRKPAELLRGEGGEKLDLGGRMEQYGITLKTLNEQMQNTAKELAVAPVMFEKEVQESGLGAALKSVDPTRLTNYMKVSTEAWGLTLTKTSDDLETSLSALDEAIIKAKEAVEEKGISKEEKAGRTTIKEGLEQAKKDVLRTAMSNLTEQKIVGPARQRMQGVEESRGQIGVEFQAAQTEYRRKFAGTGNLEEIGKMQAEINENYQKNTQLIDAGAKDARASLQATIDNAETKLKEKNLDAEGRKIHETALFIAQTELAVINRKVDSDKKILAEQTQSLDLETRREQALAAESNIMFQRQKRMLDMTKGEEELARLQGAAPEQIGAFAKKRADLAKGQLATYMETYTPARKALEEEAAKPETTEVKRLEIAAKIYEMDVKRLALNREGFEEQLHALTAESKARQEVIAPQKRAVEIQRDLAARMGLSWRHQLAYQEQLIGLSKQDLQASRTELEGMAEAIRNAGFDPEKDAKYLSKVADVMQKQAAMAEATLGKQRDFLEKSTASSFGVTMGGGSKSLPIFTQRLFGPMIQNMRGEKQAGVPQGFYNLQERQIRAANFGLVGRGAIRAEGQLPGVAPGEMAGPLAPPGLREAQQVRQAVAEGIEGKQIGVNSTIQIASVEPAFTAKVIDIVARLNQKQNRPGGSVVG